MFRVSLACGHTQRTMPRAAVFHSLCSAGPPLNIGADRQHSFRPTSRVPLENEQSGRLRPTTPHRDVAAVGSPMRLRYQSVQTLPDRPFSAPDVTWRAGCDGKSFAPGEPLPLVRAVAATRQDCLRWCCKALYLVELVIWHLICFPLGVAMDDTGPGEVHRSKLPAWGLDDRPLPSPRR